MGSRIINIYYGEDCLPYKDSERTVHYPIAQGTFMGSSNTTQIRFYYDRMLEEGETTFVAVSKLPNGKIGSKILESYFDSELNENYALLDLSNYYTQYKGDLFISLQGYQGGVRVEQDEDGIYQIYGTPTIQATGSIKLSIAYAPTFVGSGQTENITLQRVLAELSTKLGIRQETLHVEELPTVGNPNVWYVVNDDPNDTTKANIYIWNATRQTYVWVGDNTLDLGNYYTQEQGEQFEEDIDNRVSSVENELSSVASGSPKGAYATLADLQAAYPTGTTGVYVVQADGHWYFWNGTAWADGGVYLSSENYEKAMYLIGDLENKYIRFNLFDKNSPFAYQDKYIGATGEMLTLEGWSSRFFDIKGGQSLVFDLQGKRILGGYYDEDMVFISSSLFDTSQSVVTTTPANAKYMGVSCANTSLDYIRLYYGTKVEGVYEPFEKVRPSQNIDFSTVSLIANKLEKKELWGIVGKNQIDLAALATFESGKYLNYNNGQPSESELYSCSDFVKIPYNVLFVVSKGTELFYSFYDINKNYISGSSLDGFNFLLVPNNPNIEYIRFSSRTAYLPELKIILNKYLNNEDKKIVSSLLDIKKVNLIDYFIDGRYVSYTNGVFTNSDDYFVTNPIEVLPNAKYDVVGSTDGSQVAFYDKNGTFVSGGQSGASKEIQVPNNNDIKYMIWCSLATQKENSSITLHSAISDIGIEKLSKQDFWSINGKNQYNLFDYIGDTLDGYYVNYNDGKVAASQDYFATQLLKVVYGTLYFAYATNNMFVAFYDKNKTYISGYSLGSLNMISVPNNPNVEYMRFSAPLTNKNNIFIKLIKYVSEEEKKNMSSVLNIKSRNLIEYFIDNTYVGYNSGKIQLLNGWTSTNPIEVIPNAVYSLSGFVSGSQAAFYDKDGVYISGLVTGLNDNVRIPNNDNIKYMTWCSSLPNKDNMKVCLKPLIEGSNEIVVESNGSILQGLLDAYSTGAKKVIVRAGTYDIIQEYKDKYGNDYFDNYETAYNGYANDYFDTGLWLDNIEIVFEQGAKVLANYTGSNTNVKTYFSAFGVGRNVIIDGLVLEASELRYGLHPDFNGVQTEQSYLIVKNGDYSFVKGDYNCQSFGCGLGKSCLWIFENNIFRTPLDTNLAVVRIHNNGNDNVQSKIIFRNNYIFGKGRFQLNYYGPSQKITDILICGNSWVNPPQKANETAEENYDNFNLIVYNNETRS